jgi:predicted transcriptional regulator
MEIHLHPDLEAKLARIAAERGLDTHALVQEAVEHLVYHDEWLLSEMQKGLEAADRGEFIEHKEIGKLINNRYPK